MIIGHAISLKFNKNASTKLGNCVRVHVATQRGETRGVICLERLFHFRYLPDYNGLVVLKGNKAEMTCTKSRSDMIQHKLIKVEPHCHQIWLRKESHELIEAKWRIYASAKQTTIGSDNDLSPSRRQAIIWTTAGILLIGPLGTNLSEILSEIHTFSLKEMHLKMSSGKWRPFCLGLNFNESRPSTVALTTDPLSPELQREQCYLYVWPAEVY